MQTWWRAVASYPPSWIAVAAVVVAVVAIIVVLQPSTVFTAVVIVAGVVAIALWPLLLATSGTLNRLQYRAPKLPEVDAGQLRILESELARLDDPRPAYQLEAIAEKRDNLVAILDERLTAGELTYARYQSTAQQVYLAVITNLREVAIAKKSISTIDPDYIDTRLAELQVEGRDDARAEMRSLEDRRALATDQDAKAAYLMAQNESAMTLLDRTAAALADAPIGIAPQDAEAAMKELAELADRAGRYASA
ncbi:MAG: hypothetical protein AB1Z63_08890 [Candidatus Limnocylindrales bacterium]